MASINLIKNKNWKAPTTNFLVMQYCVRAAKHEKWPFSSFGPSISHLWSSVRDMLAHLKICLSGTSAYMLYLLICVFVHLYSCICAFHTWEYNSEYHWSTPLWEIWALGAKQIPCPGILSLEKTMEKVYNKVTTIIWRNIMFFKQF